jgi:putative SOS response-associated peptidase YedK
VGADPRLGKGPQDRVEDDQRPFGDVAEKPAFKAVFKKHRLHHPDGRLLRVGPRYGGGTGHQGRQAAKRPHFIHRRTASRSPSPGIWSAWRDREEGADAPWLHTASVITTNANATMAPIHDRMPVILPKAMWDVWLDPTNHNVDMLSGLLVPARDDLLTMHEVSTDVNNVRNKGIELIAAV